jgi:acyl carrier protein
MNATTNRTSIEIQDWIVSWVAKESDLAPEVIDVQEPFVNLGLSSRQAVLLAGELEDYLGSPLPASLVWDYPTIEKLAEHLSAAS